MSDHDERESAQTRTDDLLKAFDAFRAREAGRQPPEPEPFPQEAAPFPQAHETALTAMPTVIAPVAQPLPAPGPGAETPTLPLAATGFSAASEYTAVPPPPPFDPGFGKGVAAVPGRPPRRHRTRTGFILAAVAAIVIGLCAGAYSVVVKTDRNPQNSSAPPAASASASPQANDAANSKAVTALVVVDSVAANGFVATAQTGDHDPFTVQYTAATKFGTAARPFTRAQVVAGAHVWVRGRRTAFDTVTASVVAGVLESEASTAKTTGSLGV